MEFVGELVRFIKARRKFWLAPVLTLIFVFGGLVVLTEGTVIAPFIYSIF